MTTQSFPWKILFSPASLFAGLPRLFSLMLFVWGITFLSLPIVEYVYGNMAMRWAVMLGVVVQTATVLTILHLAWGVRRTVRTVAVVLVLAWVAEAVGSSIGFPFGNYSYTHKLQPQLANVPLFIPLAWLMMMPPAWAVARRLTGRWQGPTFVAVSALAFTAWDLFLDPQMVAWELWTWIPAGGYFGIPWTNYAGWLLVSALITVLARPQELPTKPLLLIYTITCILETIGLVLFWNLSGPALFGCLGMGSLAWLAWSYGRKEI